MNASILQKQREPLRVLLSANYNALGSWPLAITAYNHGRAGMLRAQDEVGSELTSIIAALSRQALRLRFHEFLFGVCGGR